MKDVLGRLFQPPAQRRLADLTARASALGWTVSAEDGSSATLAGRASDGSDFTLSVSLMNYDEPESVVWSSGAHRLDELLLAMTDTPDPSRRWLHLVEQGVTLAHDDPDPQAFRDELNARAAEGMSPRELNDYALQLGGGGVSGVLLRFSQEAVEVPYELPAAKRRLQVLAPDPDLASKLLGEPVSSMLPPVLAATKVQLDWSFLAWVGLPYSRLSIETPLVTVEALQDVIELGAALRGAALRQREW